MADLWIEEMGTSHQNGSRFTQLISERGETWQGSAWLHSQYSFLTSILLLWKSRNVFLSGVCSKFHSWDFPCGSWLPMVLLLLDSPFFFPSFLKQKKQKNKTKKNLPYKIEVSRGWVLVRDISEHMPMIGTPLFLEGVSGVGGCGVSFENWMHICRLVLGLE